jgi:hypothetical protein
MAIGSTVVTNVPVTGTTVLTLDKLKDGLYVDQVSVGGVDVPLRLELRTSSLGNLGRRFGAAYKFNPQILDVPTATSKGRITVTLNVDSYVGSEMLPGDITDHVRWCLGALLQTGLLEALRDGSLQ